MGSGIGIRPARASDADDLARFINFAGEGLPLYLWQRMAGAGDDPWQIGRQRAARDQGGFSYRNATIAEAGGKTAGGLVGYRLDDTPEEIGADLPAMFVPLQELENLAPGTWYINAVAAYPDFRGRGIGGRLLAAAEDFARQTDSRGLSLIVSDGNSGAVRLYERLGYEQVAARTMVKEDWQNPGTQWVLMTKALAES